MRVARRLGGSVSKLRRIFRSAESLSNLQYILIFRGAPVALAYAALYVVNGMFLGWQNAFDVSFCIVSPAATRLPALALPLSIAGWLVVPVLAGAIAGYAVQRSLETRRRHDDNGRAIYVKERNSR